MSDPNTMTTPVLRPKKRFRILLGVSLALNLLFVGAIAGALVNRGDPRKGPPGPRITAAPYVDAFDVETKLALRKAMRAQLPPRAQAIAANSADYQAILELLRAETFDQQRATEIMEGQFERGGQFQRIGRQLSIERITAMSVEERRAYADRLQKRLETRKRRGKRKER